MYRRMAMIHITFAHILKSPCATVSYAVKQANSGDIIEIAGGIYYESGIRIDKDLTIKGASAYDTVIDAKGVDRVLYISGKYTVGISNLKITNGKSYDGGGIENNEGIVIISNSVISSNSIDGIGGGAINNSSGTITINDSTISDNYMVGIGGGAINNSSGTITIINSTISNNSIDGIGGGAINNSNSGIIVLDNSTIKENSADFGGGIDNSGIIVLDNSTIKENSADFGGGINNSNNGIVTITNSTISGNSASIGGGINNTNSSKLTIKNSTVSGNVAEDIYNNNGGTVTIDNSTISGGIGNGSGTDNTVNIKNTIIAGNAYSEGILNSYGYNLILDTGGCTINNIQNFGTDIIGKDSLLGPLAENGGATLTHSLLTGSPAIDAGSCTDINGNYVSTDQRGYKRPQGITCDIGAFESN